MSAKVIVNMLGIASSLATERILPTTVVVGEQVVNRQLVSYIWECETLEAAQHQAEVLWMGMVGAKVVASDEEEIGFLKEIENIALNRN